jgi:hypothetical protein
VVLHFFSPTKLKQNFKPFSDEYDWEVPEEEIPLVSHKDVFSFCVVCCALLQGSRSVCAVVVVVA